MHSAKIIFIGLILSLFIFAVPSSTFAQTPSKGLESCFQYYDYGKVQAHLSSEKSEYKPGETVQLKGQIINKNTFPLVDVVLYAQVRRVNENTYAENGHFLIDKFIMKDGLSFLQNETKNIELSLNLKSTYPNGSYIIQYYIFSKQSFHYGGRSFLEEDFAGTTSFVVKNGKDPQVYFDVDNVMANNEKKTIRGLAFEFPKGTITFKVNILDTRPTKGTIPVSIKFYSFEDDLESRLVSKSNTTIEEGKTDLQFDFNPPEQGAYVLVVETNSPQHSILKYRFAAVTDRASELRMNDLGVSSFPATNNGRAWVCFHSPSFEKAPNTTVNLSLLSSSKKVLDQVSMTDSFDFDVHAISIPLSKLTTLNDFWISAQFINPDDTSHSRSVEIHFECSKFTESISDVSLLHNPDNPFVLRVEGKNKCGTSITKGKINNLRVLQDTVVKKEMTNILTMPYEMNLEDLKPGHYMAQVKVGSIKKDLAFDIPADTQKKITPSLTRNIPMIYIGIICFMVIAIIAMFLYKNKLKK